MHARIHSFAAAWLALALGIGQAPDEGPARGDRAGRDDHAGPPSVALFLADDLGYSDPGCYGGEIPTPAIDGLAAEGVRFARFYTSARCWTTRAALLTGYHAQQVRRDKPHGVKLALQGQRPPWAKLLPALLRRAGYHSYHSGKWHLDGTPLEGGFERSYWIESTGDYFTPSAHSLDGEPLPPVEDSGFYLTTRIADRAIEFLRGHAEHHAEDPFFLYVAFTAPHHPLQAEPADVEAQRGRYDAGFEAVRARRFERQRELGLFDAEAELSPVERELGPGVDADAAHAFFGPGELVLPLAWEVLTAEQRAFQATKMQLHAAMVARMDRELGRVLAELDALGARENTLVLFLSDNGASAELQMDKGGHDPDAPPGSDGTYLSLGPGWSTVSNTPFRRHKSWVHEGGVATPLVARWPARLREAGALRTAPGHVIDLAPTLVELAGLEPPRARGARPEWPGASLVSTLLEDAPRPADELWFLHDESRAIRRGSHKLVAARGEPWQLYDLERDPTETRDLAREEPELVRELRARWHRRDDEYAAQAAKLGNAPAAQRKQLPLLGRTLDLEGNTAFLITAGPRVQDPRPPWVLYAPSRPEYPGLREDWLLRRFAEEQLAVAGTDTGLDLGGPRDRAALEELYLHMAGDRDFAPKVALLLRADGGQHVLGWAAEHPERITCLVGLTPAFDLALYPGLALASELLEVSADELATRPGGIDAYGAALALARARVPALVLSDPAEPTFEPTGGAELFERAYAAAGASERLTVLEHGQGEGQVASIFRSEEVVRFLAEHAR